MKNEWISGHDIVEKAEKGTIIESEYGHFGIITEDKKILLLSSHNGNNWGDYADGFLYYYWRILPKDYVIEIGNHTLTEAKELEGY